MICHMVAWTFKEGITAEEKSIYAQRIKNELESLKSCVEGIHSIEVKTTLLPSSNLDLLLISRFENEEALLAYQEHPSHKEAGAFIRSVLTNRQCMDYTE